MTMAGAGGNGDKLILSRINLLLLRQVPVEPHQEVRVSSKIVGTYDCSKGEALLVHAVSKSPQGCWTQLREVALHHIGQEKVNQGHVTLDPVPSEALELWTVVTAEQHGEHHRHLAKVLLIPLDICNEHLCECRWILCPELLLNSLLAEKPTVHVEAEYAIEHVHAICDVMVPEEVAVWVGSEDSWRSNLLTGCGHVVGSGLGRCSRHLADNRERMNRRA